MSKTLYAKKVNKNAKKLNRQIMADVFGDRFYCRQYKKAFGEDGIEYFQYEFLDKECPNRNYITYWFNVWEIIRSNKLWEEMNNFIITSDFWSKYKNNS